MNPRGAQCGWTLIELVLIVGLIAVLAQAAMWNGAPLDEHKAEIAAAEVTAALRFARAEAARTGGYYGVRISAGNDRIRVFRGTRNADQINTDFDVVHPITKKIWDIDFDDYPLATGVDLTTDRVWRGDCDSPAHVVFSPDGTPSCRKPVTVLLEHIDYHLDYGSAHRTVRIDGFTGRVSPR